MPEPARSLGDEATHRGDIGAVLSGEPCEARDVAHVCRRPELGLVRCGSTGTVVSHAGISMDMGILINIHTMYTHARGSCRCRAYQDAKRLLAEAGVNGGRQARLEVGDAGQELDGALAGQEVVVSHAGDGDHGEAAVLDLGELAAGEGVRVRLEAERVEAEVAGAVNRAVGKVEHEGDLEEAHEEEHLPHGAGLDRSVVEAPHLLALVPLGHEGEGVEVLHDGAGGGEHADAAVLHLGLARPDHVTDGAEEAAVDRPVGALGVPLDARVVGVALHRDLLRGRGAGRAGGQGSGGEGRGRRHKASESSNACVHGYGWGLRDPRQPFIDEDF